MRFPRKNGIVVAEGDGYSKETEKKMRIKYKDKMLFALGVAVIENKDGTVEG